MGKPPAVVIIARSVEPRQNVLLSIAHGSSRHGARLDAADKQWHLTSPTPYDPPLTYGGWKQAQALGGRIASVLHSRENSLGSQPEISPTSHGHEKEGAQGQKPNKVRKRKQRVIIHSSPFLRCIQTSIGISAGIKQQRGLQKAIAQPSNPKSHQPRLSGSPHLRARDHPQLVAIPEPGENGGLDSQEPLPRPKQSSKSRLRIDAFLGEWLSPDYFEMITPPPNSVMMIASAKADLLRQGEGVEILQSSLNGNLSRGNFPGGWGSDRSETTTFTYDSDEGPLARMSEVRGSLPRLSRSNSHERTGPSGTRAYQFTGIMGGKAIGGYTPPTPTYAISPAEAIPPGYVAHARDACVEVDYQWDSMRLPHDWGDGGSLGEEWSSMHRRFRRGLHNMISWYRTCDTRRRAEKSNGKRPNGEEKSNEDDEDDEDTVVVLVTHGAGCNALIGALTNQPVLLDVGMASLTMAVRKTRPQMVHESSSSVSSSDDTSTTAFSTARRRSSIDSGISHDYELKLTASTDHLRPSSSQSPYSTSLTQRSATFSGPNSTTRYRPGFSTGSSRSTYGIDQNDQISSYSSIPTPTGLWTKPVSRGSNDQPRSSSETRVHTSFSREKFLLENNRPRRVQDENLSKTTTTDSCSSRLSTGEISTTSTPPSSSGLVSETDEEDGDGDFRFASTITAPASAATSGGAVGIAAGISGGVGGGLWSAEPPQVLCTARDKGQKRRWTHSEH
ncbi:hypothetical protein MMC31_007112 [Peltigera leucophlebia]|nr:hypothetical protein [Peltigera leucophlebia]